MRAIKVVTVSVGALLLGAGSWILIPDPMLWLGIVGPLSLSVWVLVRSRGWTTWE